MDGPSDTEATGTSVVRTDSLSTPPSPEILNERGLKAGFAEDIGRRAEMEDAHVALENFRGRPDQGFFAIYDGHGGREVADFAAQNLHQNVMQMLAAGAPPLEALKEAYDLTDEDIKNAGIDDRQGATAITALVISNQLYVANAGDARAVLDRNGTALRLSHDHKASDPNEQARIEQAGGKVVIDKNDGIARVQDQLAVGRALGDHGLKQFVTSEPNLHQETIQPQDSRVILACDGVWDVMTDQEALDLIKGEQNPDRAAQILKDEALRRGTTDNVTAMVVNLPSQEQPSEQAQPTPENPPAQQELKPDDEANDQAKPKDEDPDEDPNEDPNEDPDETEDIKPRPNQPETPGEEPPPSPERPPSVNLENRSYAAGNESENRVKAAMEIATRIVQHEQERGSILNPLNLGRKIGMSWLGNWWRGRLADQIMTITEGTRNAYSEENLDKINVRLVDLFKGQVASLQPNIDTSANQADFEGANKAHVQMVKDLGETGRNIKALDEAAKAVLFREVINPMRKGETSPLAGIGIIDINDPIQLQNALRTFITAHQSEPEFADMAAMFKDARTGSQFSQEYATDLKQLALDYNALLNQGHGEDEIEKHSKILLANKVWAAAGQPHHDALTNTIRTIENNRLLGVTVPPAVIAAGFAIGTLASRAATGSVASWVVGGPLGGVVAATALAGMRRRAEVFQNTQQVRVEHGAYGVQTKRDASGRPVSREEERRADLEQFVYETSTPVQLQTELRDALGGDMNDVAERDRAINALADIKARMDLAEETTALGKTVDLITFESKTRVEQGRADLVRERVTAIRQLEAQLIGATNPDGTPFDLDAVLTQRVADRITHFRDDVVRPVDSKLARHATIEGIKAAAVTGYFGALGWLGSQELFALVGRGADALFGTHFRPGATIVENALHGNFSDLTNPGKAAAFGIEQTQELYKNPNGAALENGMRVVADANHRVTFVDPTGNILAGPDTHISPDGKLSVDGKLDAFPSQIRTVLEQWNPHETTTPSVADRIAESLNSGRTETFQQGSLNVVIDGANKVLSIVDPASNVDIKVPLDPNNLRVTIDESKFPGVNFDDVRANLAQLGFTGTETHQPGGNALDNLLNQSPDTLHQKGIVETDQVAKRWNFHVLRPDIVSSTGNHTHNELTLHVGQFRGSAGAPGLLNFGGELTQGLIPSHLQGVEPATDRVLSQLITNAGAINHQDMVMVVDLLNDKQIMLPMDASGNAHLPQELFNPQTGELQGIKTIAAAVLQQQDGTVLKGGELLQTGKIPEGLTVHSLASERFPSVPVPNAPDTNLFTIEPPTDRGVITDLTPPPNPDLTVPPAAPLIPILVKPVGPGTPGEVPPPVVPPPEPVPVVPTPDVPEVTVPVDLNEDPNEDPDETRDIKQPTSTGPVSEPVAEEPQPPETPQRTPEQAEEEGETALTTLRDRGVNITFTTTPEQVVDQLSRLANPPEPGDPAMLQQAQDAINQARAEAGEYATEQLMELGIYLKPDSNIDQVMKELSDPETGKGWTDDETTRDFVQAGIDNLKSPDQTPRIEIPENPLGRAALKEIRGLINVTADSRLDNLKAQLKERGWQIDQPETEDYIEAAIEQAEAESPKKLEIEPVTSNTRYLTSEIKGSDTQTIYLERSARAQLGVKPGQTITLHVGNKVQTVTVQRPLVRDDGTIEGSETPIMRVSADVLQTLGLPKAYAVLPHFDSATQEIFLNSPESPNSSILRMREPRNITKEAGTTGNTVFLSADEMARFGVSTGENITLRFGGVTRELNIQESQASANDSWRLSEQLAKELGFPEEIKFRSKYNKNNRVLSFGPGVAVYMRNQAPNAKELSQNVSDYGGYVVFINPNQQEASDLDQGFVTGKVLINGDYVPCRVPRPNVLYNRTPGIIENGAAQKLTSSFEHHVIPNEHISITFDKMHFDDVLKRSDLEGYRQESQSLNNITAEELQAFFDRHQQVVIKPQFGSKGEGVFYVSRLGNQFVITERIVDPTTRRSSKKETAASSISDLLEKLPTLDAMQGTQGGLSKSMIQERIDLMNYEYNDPANGERITGSVEPRVLVQRGVDGRIRIGGIATRIQNDNYDIPHTRNMFDVLNNIYQNDPDRQEKVNALMQELETVTAKVLRAVEQESREQKHGRPIGEMIVDFGLTSDFKWKVMEANARGSNEVFTYNPDAREQMTGGVAEYSLSVTGMN
jgi:serine/threonine protein phosphatase PrpC